MFSSWGTLTSRPLTEEWNKPLTKPKSFFLNVPKYHGSGNSLSATNKGTDIELIWENKFEIPVIWWLYPESKIPVLLLSESEQGVHISSKSSFGALIWKTL